MFVEGMLVAGLARRVDRIKEIAESLEDCSGKLHAVECDVSKEESVVSAFAWVQENLGSVSVLVNSAGITKESSLIGIIHRRRCVLNSLEISSHSCSFVWFPYLRKIGFLFQMVIWRIGGQFST